MAGRWRHPFDHGLVPGRWLPSRLRRSERAHQRRVTTFARLISWVGHPLVFVLASVAIVVGTQLGPCTGFPILLALLLSTLVPTRSCFFPEFARADGVMQMYPSGKSGSAFFRGRFRFR